jgi:hypothetical protein
MSQSIDEVGCGTGYQTRVSGLVHIGNSPLIVVAGPVCVRDIAIK